MQETQQNGKKYLTGADLVIRALIDENVDTIFGYPGGQVLAIYDALEAHKKQIKHILTAHEQGAAHAADGYARATGKVGSWPSPQAVREPPTSSPESPPPASTLPRSSR